MIQRVPVLTLYTFSYTSFEKISCKLKDSQPFIELTTLVRGAYRLFRVVEFIRHPNRFSADFDLWWDNYRKTIFSNPLNQILLKIRDDVPLIL